jgi:hypothetical protein
VTSFPHATARHCSGLAATFGTTHAHRSGRMTIQCRRPPSQETNSHKKSHRSVWFAGARSCFIFPSSKDQKDYTTRRSEHQRERLTATLAKGRIRRV